MNDASSTATLPLPRRRLPSYAAHPAARRSRRTDRALSADHSRLGDIPDHDLLSQAVAGNHDAWCTLLSRHNPMLEGIARRFRLSPSETADVCQLTWMRLLQKHHTLRDPSRLRWWLATTARREALKRVTVRTREVLGDGSTAELAPFSAL